MSSLISRLGSFLLLASSALSAQLTQVTDFGTNPTNVGMFIYVPDAVVENPPILVAMHYCTGTAQAYFMGTKYAQLADQKGFIIIYPDAPDSGGCWDVHTDETLTHDAGGDSLGIASMVRYTLDKYSADKSRVFMAGSSSGAMMTQVMAGAYPDIFKGGASVSGVPYGCFKGPSMWNSQCSSGQLTMSAEEWGDMVRAGYPDYTGPRPKMQIWHGTADTTLTYPNYDESLKEWSNVLGVSLNATNENTPQSGYTQSIYGTGELVGYSAEGVGHTVPEHEDMVLEFFGL